MRAVRLCKRVLLLPFFRDFNKDMIETTKPFFGDFTKEMIESTKPDPRTRQTDICRGQCLVKGNAQKPLDMRLFLRECHDQLD